MKEELQSIEDSETCDLQVNLPPRRNPVGSKWVISELPKPKLRDSRRGWLQTFWAAAAMQGMMIRQYDVNSAFLYGNLKEEIYSAWP